MVPCVKVTWPDMDDGRSSVVYPIKAFSAEDEFGGAEIGEKIGLEYCEMTQEDLDALPEFKGW